jgi:hypothetical protein
MKKKVGLVTYYKENYGSVLQCYATKYFLSSLGLECDVIYRMYKTRMISAERMTNIFRHAMRAIWYKGYLEQYVSMHKAMNGEKSYLIDDAKKKLDEFISAWICPKGYTWKQLCQIGKDSEYVAFVAGSDQIWNASINIDPVFFLKFTKKEKRIAFAPSFGVSEIPTFNKRDVQNGINGFNRIAVREETGEQILSKLSSVPYVRIADPVVMLTKSEWNSFSESAHHIDEPYIFAHFLNRPSDTAICAINMLSSTYNLRVILFSYDYSEFTKIKKGKKISGDPIDYVGLINNAEYICTDSFHTTMLSIILNKKFYTFQRQYLHSSNQSSRIIDLVKRYGLEQYYISGNLTKMPEWKVISWNKINDRLANERNLTRDYLETEIAIRKNESLCI